MKHAMVSLVAGLLIFAAPVHAQEEPSTSRIAKQHKISTFQKQHMKQSEESILASILSESVATQQSAIQTLRELEQLAPDYPFSNLVGPLADKLRNDQTHRVVRKLAALALDELHSEAGDEVIRDMAQQSEDPCLKSLCEALVIRINRK